MPPTQPPPPSPASATPSTSAQPALRVAAPPAVPPRKEVGFLPGTTRWLAAAVLFVVGVVVGGGLMVASQLSGGAVDPELRTLMVDTMPSGAIVVLNGDKLGVTPLVVDRHLEDGVHTVRLTATKGGAVSRKVQAKPGERTIVVSASLVTHGVVRVETRPPGAEISLDGDEVGKSPVTIDRVSTDRPHTVEATLEGYNLESATVPSERDELYTMTLPLTSARGNGTLTIRTSSPADVELDGSPWGPTGPDGRSCAPGQHRVVLTSPGVPRSPTYTVIVPPKGEARYYFDLGSGSPGPAL
ncbi:MAG: PEGA domain-containing protein [Deltaproteobacteria bacterium]|nr:PEGA domain-containing protein [Deltaproteobacteria bacterium]